jgi:hypothetical protein
MLFAEGLSRRRDCAVTASQTEVKCRHEAHRLILALRPDCHFPCGAGLHILGCLPLAPEVSGASCDGVP